MLVLAAVALAMSTGRPWLGRLRPAKISVLKRAIVAQVGLGANLPEDAIYPLNLGDEAGRPLDGTSKYSIHFEKGATPPVSAFWSITLYDREGFQVANSLNRFAVSSWMPCKYNADGSLDLYFQNDSPGKDKEANWLPAPKGAFNLTMRLYAPKSDALTGSHKGPGASCPDGAIANQQGADAIASAAPGAGHGACPPMQGLSGWLSMQP